MDRGRGGAAAPRHRLRDEYDGIARWLRKEEPPDTRESAKGITEYRAPDATAKFVRAQKRGLGN